MPNLDELFRQRQEFLNKRQIALLNTTSKLEAMILELVLKEFVQFLKVNKGIIEDGKQNLKLTQALEKIFNRFRENDMLRLAGQLANDYMKINTLNKDYYSLFDASRFEKIAKDVEEYMRLRIGLTDKGEIIKNGYLDKLISDPTLRTQVKDASVKAVLGGTPLKDFQDTLQRIIVGNDTVDGGLTQHIKGFAYDSYQQFDRANNKRFAVELELKAFIYAGGIIDDSRAFCIHRNNKVFTLEETELWINDPDLPKATDERKNGVVDYNPIIDMGRWNCRHTARFISEQQAIRQRPDLRTYFQQ